MATEHLSLFDFAPGKRVLGRFEVVGSTRQNDLALTYAAKLEDGSACELTFFPPGLFDTAEQLKGFLAHWETWKKVESEHVLGLREIIPVESECALLVSDAPVGVSLRDWVSENKSMSIEQAVDLGKQLARGLEPIHAAGLVHGDIKPQTICVDTNGSGALKAALVGGGVTTGLWNAKGLGDQTALIGTPYYAPVEQFGGESPDVQSDVYNVATVLFELITGVLPWAGKNFLEIFQAKLDKSAPSMRRRAPKVEVSAEVESAVVRGLLADRAERYQSAPELLAGLSEL